MAAQIAVGDDADQPAVAVDHADAAEALGGDFENRLAHGRVRFDERQAFARMHHVAHEAQACAKLAAGMEQAEVARREAARLEQRDGQGVAHGELHRRGRGRREAVGTGFLGLGQSKADVGLPPQRAVGGRGDRDERNGEALGVGDDVGKFGGLARPRQREDHVLLPHHAEIAMAGFARMDEIGGRARGGHCRGDLARDMAGLAHARDDGAAGGGHDPRHGRVERVAKALGRAVPQRVFERGYARALKPQGAQGRRARRRDGQILRQILLQVRCSHGPSLHQRR